MELGFVGLGRMGGNMVTRLARGGHRIVAWDPSAEATKRARDNGADLAASLAELPKALKPPRAVWVMVPAGEPTESTIRALAGALERGDTIIDGGNTKWKDDIRRGKELAARGLHYVDAGTSGGIWDCRTATASWSAATRRRSTGWRRCSRRSRRPTAGCTWAASAPGIT